MTESGMRFIEPNQPDGRIVAAEVDGQLTAHDMKAMVERLQTIVDRGEKALLYVDMKNYEGFKLGVVSEKLKHMGLLWRALEKYAIVGDARWLEVWIRIVDPLTPQQIRHFRPENSDEAWEWLRASDATEGAEASNA